MKEVKQEIINEEVVSLLKNTPMELKDIEENLDKMVENGKLTKEEKDNAMAYAKQWHAIACEFRKNFLQEVLNNKFKNLFN